MSAKDIRDVILSQRVLIPASIVASIAIAAFYIGGWTNELRKSVDNNTAAVKSLSESIWTVKEMERWTSDLRESNPGMRVPRVR